VTPHYFNYLLTRLRGLENLIRKTSPKIPIDGHQAHHDQALADLKGQLSEGLGAKIKAARVRKPGVFHYQFSDVEPTLVSYEEASAASGYAVSTLRMRVSEGGGATCFYKSGRWQVLSRTQDMDQVQRALRTKFNATGNPDDVRELRPKGKF